MKMPARFLRAARHAGGAVAMRSRKGFSTLEILLVLTILLVITSFALPAVFRKIDEARDVAAVTTLHSLNSVYTLSNALLSVDGTVGVTAPPGNITVHVPQRAGEAANAYAGYIARQMDYAYGGAPPVYEITLASSQGDSGYSIACWMEPQKHPQLCYVLCGSTITRTERAQPDSTADAAR